MPRSGCLYHAKRSLEFCGKNGIGDFDLAFTYEAMERAYMTLKDTDNMNEYLDKAVEASSHIAMTKDKEYFLSELKTITY